MPKVLLIDVDDTLLSFEQYVEESMRSGFSLFGIGPFKKEMLSVFHRINRELWQRLEQGTLSFEELKRIRWNRIFDALGIRADGLKFEEYFRDCLFDSAIPVEGAMELLEYLRGRYILCAASNGPYLQQINRLKKGKMLDFFSHLFISEELGCSKPSKAFFELCLERLNKDRPEPFFPQDLMIIGDSLSSDIAGGISFGMQTLFYNPNKREIPPQIMPEHSVFTLQEIKNIL